jgi:hypothetical protein
MDDAQKQLIAAGDAIAAYLAGTKDGDVDMAKLESLWRDMFAALCARLGEATAREMFQELARKMRWSVN